MKDDELTFSRAVEIAAETEEAAKAAKEITYGIGAVPVNKVVKASSRRNNPARRVVPPRVTQRHVTVVEGQVTNRKNVHSETLSATTVRRKGTYQQSAGLKQHRLTQKLDQLR